MEEGIKKLTLKHGKICGLWLGNQRFVVVADYEVLQNIMHKSETSARQDWPVAGKLEVC